eukprot:3803272-Rhodomonas_salina.2
MASRQAMQKPNSRVLDTMFRKRANGGHKKATGDDQPTPRAVTFPDDAAEEGTKSRKSNNRPPEAKDVERYLAFIDGEAVAPIYLRVVLSAELECVVLPGHPTQALLSSEFQNVSAAGIQEDITTTTRTSKDQHREPRWSSV